MMFNRQPPPRTDVIRSVKDIDYKDVELLGKFLTPQAQILSRRRTSFSAQRQRVLKLAIKRARHLALLPFVG